MLLLAARLLIASSFVLAGIQDIKERAIYDYLWIPGGIGAAIAVYWSTSLPPLLFYADLMKLAIFAGATAAFVLTGKVGQADAIAMVLIGADPSIFSYLSLAFAGVAVVVAVAALWKKGFIQGRLNITYEQFVKESRWIPYAVINDGERTELPSDVNVSHEKAVELGKAGGLVEVSYGFPVVSYLAAGYVAFLVLSIFLGF